MTMSAAELTVAREFLGLTGGWIASTAGYSARTQRRWEAGDTGIPQNVQALVETLEKLTHDTVTWLINRLQHARSLGVMLLRDDAAYQAAAPAGAIALPARWHHHVAARATLDFPGALNLMFDDEPGPRWLRFVGHVPHLTPHLDNINYAVTVGGK